MQDMCGGSDGSSRYGAHLEKIPMSGRTLIAAIIGTSSVLAALAVILQLGEIRGTPAAAVVLAGLVVLATAIIALRPRPGLVDDPRA